MIRIRYRDFSAGTHDVPGLQGRAERRAREVTVYLLPGLTTWQRRAVIRRLRQEASRGFGPPLPLPQLTIALGLDRIRTAASIVTAIVRLHPAVTLVPSAFVVAMMTLFVIASAGRPGITPGTQGGLAAAAGSAARAASAEPSRARMTWVTAADGTGGTDVGGTGLGSGQRGPGRQAHEGHPTGKPPVRGSVRQGAWYACLQAMTAMTPRPRAGQLACRRPAPRAVPHTAHLPGPLDFAW